MSTYYVERIVLGSWISRLSYCISKDKRRSWNVSFERIFSSIKILRLVLGRTGMLLTG